MTSSLQERKGDMPNSSMATVSQSHGISQTFAAKELKKLGGMAAVVKMFRLPGLDMKELAGLVLANITGEGNTYCKDFLGVGGAAVCALVESAGDERGKVRELGSKVLANVSAVEDAEELKRFSRAFSANGVSVRYAWAGIGCG